VPDYVYEEHGRRPAVLAVIAVAMIMVWVGVQAGAPWYFLAPVGLGGVMALAMAVVNRRSGMSLQGDQLALFSGQWSQTIATADIASVWEARYSDGQPSITLRLRDGSAVRIPGMCFGASVPLLSAFRARGITVA
jgi:hypothetical protein